MCKFSSKSGGVPFQNSFFLGDLTRNDPDALHVKISSITMDENIIEYFIIKSSILCVTNL